MGSEMIPAFPSSGLSLGHVVPFQDLRPKFCIKFKKYYFS